MPKRAIAVDSMSGMHYYANKQDIHILPLHIYFEEKEFLDVVEISSEHFFKWKRENPNVDVSTSPPKLENILQFFNTLITDGYDELLVIAPSSKISQTQEFIDKAATMIGDQLRVETFDTKMVGFNQGIFALAAARLSDKGLPIDDVLVHLSEIHHKNCFFGGSDSTEYFLQSTQAVRALDYRKSVFQVKPIATLDDGCPRIIAKTMSKDKAMSNICLRAQDFINSRPFMAFIMSSSPEETEYLFKQKIKQHLKVSNVPCYPIPPSLAVHVGEHFYGLGIFLR